MVKLTPVLVFHTTHTASWKIRFKCLSQGHNNLMPSTDIELQSLTRCSNQLNCTATNTELVVDFLVAA